MAVVRDMHTLYRELKEKLTETLLGSTTAQIVAAYKGKQYHLLRRYADRNGIPFEKECASKAFARLIGIYHPDTIKQIHNRIDTAYRDLEIGQLRYFTSVYLEEQKVPEIAFDYYEDYGLSEDDYVKFGIRIADESELFDENEDLADTYDYGISFADAVNKAFCRGVRYDWNITDLRRLEGDLELQYLNIDDLSGIEECVNVSGLNLTCNRLTNVDILRNLTSLETLFLAENRIEDISFAAELTNLRELDVSFNNISNLEPLLELHNLRYLNLIGNPISDREVIDELSARDMVVIF